MPDEIDLSTPEAQAAIATAAAKLAEESGGGAGTAEIDALKASVTKLEGNNKALLDEKRQAEATAADTAKIIDSLGGAEGVEGLKRIQAESEKNASLKLLSEGKLDEFYETVTSKHTDALHREVDALKGEKESIAADRDSVIAKYNGKLVDIAVRDAATKAGVVPSAIDDIVFRAGRSFTVQDDEIVSLDESGATRIGADGRNPFSLAEWVEEQREVAPHWWPQSQSGGAGGSKGGAGGAGPDNPWSKGNWNMTEQGRVVNTQGREKAEQMARAAGSHIGATRPAA